MGMVLLIGKCIDRSVHRITNEIVDTHKKCWYDAFAAPVDSTHGARTPTHTLKEPSKYPGKKVLGKKQQK